jgi:hypothetical protein
VELDWKLGLEPDDAKQGLSERSQAFRNRLGAFPSIIWANIILPDEIPVTKDDHIVTNYDIRDRIPSKDYFLIRYQFSVNPVKNILNKLGIQMDSIDVSLTIENTDFKQVIVHTANIFPRDEVANIGEVVKKYKIRSDFSTNS